MLLLLELSVVELVTFPPPSTVAFFPESTVWLFPASFEIVTEELVLLVTSTDLFSLLVLTELPSAPFDKFISVSAPELTSTLTFELSVVPSAPSATLIAIALSDEPSTDTVALELTSTVPTVPVTLISILAGESIDILSIFPFTSNLKLLFALVIRTSLIPAVSDITICPAEASKINTLPFAFSVHVSDAI